MDLPILKADTSDIERQALVDSFLAWVDGYLNQVNKKIDSSDDVKQAKMDIKQCEDLEDRIKRFEQLILEREGVLRLRSAQKSLANNRCMLTREVKSRSDKQKDEKVQFYEDCASSIVDEMQNRMKYHFEAPEFDGRAVIKGKKTIASVEKALQDALLGYQDEVSQYFAEMNKRSKVFDDSSKGYEFIFNSPVTIIKSNDINTIKELVANKIDSYNLSQQYKPSAATPDTPDTVEDVDTETGEIVEVKMVSITETEYQHYIKLKQFIKSLNHFGLKHWEHYEDACNHACDNIK